MLTDDCWRIVLKELSLVDFINISQVDKQLRKLTKEVQHDEIVYVKDITNIPKQFHKNLSMSVSYGYYKNNVVLSIYDELNTSQCQFINISKMLNIHTLDISQTDLSDVSMFKNIRELNISQTDVTDVSMLINIIKLDISYTDVSDVSTLINLIELNASHTNVTDVSMLVNLIELNASHTNVDDVSTLVNLEYLYIIATKITNVSNLKKLICLECSESVDTSTLICSIYKEKI